MNGASHTGERVRRFLHGALLGYPAFMLGLLFVAPLLSLVAVSFYRHLPGGTYVPVFTLDNYLRFFQPLYLGRLGYTVWVSALTAVIATVLAMPFTYYVARVASPARRKWALTLAIGTLWLTYVIRALGWSILLSRTGGLGRLLWWMGLLDEPRSWTPGFVATLLGFVYVYLPFMILSLYGTLRSIHPELEEASLNLGADRFRTLLHVVLPLARRGIVSGMLLVFLLTMGTYEVPVILGRPQDWTLPVFITDQVTYESNTPFGAAMSIVLALLVAGLLWVGARLFGARGLAGVIGRG